MARPFAGKFSSSFAALLSLLLCTTSNAAQSPQTVDFNFHIRPLLSDRCFKCHGPDEKSRKAKLRLDIEEEAYAARDADSATRGIVPGKPSESELVRRITSTDPDEQMPPPDSNLKLSADEISLIKQWVKQGAKYKPHWAFIAPEKIDPPKPKKRQSANPIDRFVIERLQREKRSLAPEANKETLIRRVSFDLTGLPPSIEDIRSFKNDASPGSYEKVVDRLLASPAYGERMANDWLDVARYADTYGYQSDVERDMSPWRDWVIRAFNENLPYDRFITWQIAGDLLPNATDDQILATAFNRLHRQTNEGGSIEEEFRAEYVADRVHTMGTAFLGLTLECSRCHDHKYDPITQKNYYQLFAFFNNIDESGLYPHFTRATPAPTMLLYEGDAKTKHADLKQQIAAKEKELAQIATSANGPFENWLKGGDYNVLPRPIASFDFGNITDGKTASRVGSSLATLAENPQSIDGNTGKALRFDGENSVSVKDIAHFKRTDPFSFSLWLKPMERQDRAVILHHSRAWSDSGSRGYELVLEKGRPSFALIHFWPGNAVGIRAREELPTNQWTHLTLTYDGSSRAAGLKIFRDGQLMPFEIVRDNLSKDILHRAQWGDSDVGNIDLTLAARFRDSGFKNGLIDEFQVFDHELTPPEVKKLAGQNVSAIQREELFPFYLREQHPAFQRALAELKKLRDAENDLVNDIREIMVMREMPQRRQTFLLNRGAYDAPGEQVEPGTPERIFAFASTLPKNRLGFAQWLVDRRNPLTARVAVNRIWAMHFGRGLVPTLEDFGSQGELPSHPELLDWLANEFVASGWDVKALHKLIVMSATYRQTSSASASLLAADPENRLLAHGPKHRLSAEQIRDEALAVSGLLSRKLGGPSVKPYQPAGLWEESGTGKSYAQDSGENLYRRSFYTFWRRTAPPPSMLNFDATSREVCVARRQTTATPLQSLTLLNDPQFLEAARVLAEKIFRDANGSLDVMIATAFQSVLCREAEARERHVLRRLYDEQHDLFAGNPDAAEKFLAIGEHARDKTLPSAKIAAAAVLIHTLMNHDEFVMKR